MAQTAAATGSRERVKFETNIPQILRLDSNAEGTFSKGQFGDQYQYFFEGSKIAWLDPHVQQAVIASGAKRGDEITICKRERKDGNKRGIVWEVNLITDETGGDEPWPETPELSDPDSIRYAQWEREERGGGPPPNDAAGWPQPVPMPPAAVRRPVSMPQSAAAQLDPARAVYARMDEALRMAEKLRTESQRRIGGDFGVPDWQVEDVNKMAITLFIEMGKVAR